jgi:MFS family permease
MVDCKNLLCGINLWLAVAAAGLAIPVWLRLINPGLILVWVFLMGIGFAFNAPASISIVPEIVSDAELPAATTLSGLQLNIAGIVGPPLGGLLVQLLGASFVFLVNAACFLFVIIAIRQCCLYFSMAKSPILFKYSDFTSKFTCGVCLCVNGIYSPDRAIPGCRGAGRCWVDSVCFRTLGGGTTCYAKLGARSHERRSHHGFAGSYGSWRSDLGLYSHEGWTEFYIAWRGVPVPD